MLADDASARRPARLRVYLDGHPCLPRLGLPPAAAAPGTGRPAMPPVAWFEPDGGSLQPGGDGRPREVHVEAAVLLGLPRWTDPTLPTVGPGWSVRPGDAGLCLCDPTGQVFAIGIGEVPDSWAAAARSGRQVLAVYGLRSGSRRGGTPAGQPRRTPDDELRGAQRAGLVAAGLVAYDEAGAPRPATGSTGHAAP